MTNEPLTCQPRRRDAGTRDEPLLLFFYSPTSGPSRRMDGLVSCLYVRERARLRLRKVDVDVCRDVAERCRIKTVPTLMLVKRKQIVAQVEGRVTGKELRDTMLPHLRAS